MKSSSPSIGAMIFAAGLGTRFKPWTDRHPKALALVHGKSLLQRNIEYLQRYGIRELVLNVHHFPDQILSAIDKNKAWGSRIQISDEREEVLETGGGLRKAAPLLDFDHIVLINVDVLTDLPLDQMLTFHLQQQPLATLAVTNRTTSRYFLFDESKQLCGWRNTQTGQERICREAPLYLPYAFSGVHIVQGNLPRLIQSPGKIGIVEVYLQLAATHPVLAFDHSGSRFVDVGKPESVALAEKLFP